MAYTIQKGDTLTSIAQKLGTTVKALAKTNNIADINRIYAGHTLMLPGEVPATDHPLGNDRSLMTSSPAPTTSGSMPNGTAGSRILTSPSQIPDYNIQGQVGKTGAPGSYLYGTPRNLTAGTAGTPGSTTPVPDLTGGTSGVTSPAPTAPAQSKTPGFNDILAAMLKAAQGAGNEDLQAKRNAIIQARFNAGREATPEELRILSPEAQSSIRNLTTKGLETQLGGVDAALKARQDRTASQIDAAKTALTFLQPKEISPGASLVDPVTGKTIYTAPAAEDLPASAKEYEYAKKQGYTGTYEQYQNEDANRKRSISNTYISNSGLDGKTATRVQGIVNQFRDEPVVKEYNTIATAVAGVKNAGSSPTDDIQRIYTFAKVMDPNSAVREGEYKTVQEYSTALYQRYGLNVARVFDNRGFLTEEARNLMLATLNRKLKVAQSNYDNMYNETSRQINKETGNTDGGTYLPDYSKAYKGTNNTAGTTSGTTSSGLKYTVSK